MAISNLSGAKFVKRGYGQVEPNHLSAQRTGQIYAQLPAKKDIELLQNGQFVKYDYANGQVNFTGKGEWMMVFNEVKLYRDREQYEDFAMKAGAYNARVYSPIGQKNSDMITVMNYEGEATREGSDIPYTTSVGTYNYPELMGTDVNGMVPRVIKVNVGDIWTSNLIDEETVAAGDELAPNEKGILNKAAAAAEGANFKVQVVKVYTLADGQPAAKLMRIA